ncbi:MAG: PBP1A family penicillin-binding protein [Desulfobulbaceae bacterium]|nr:PBP1A family penicillin-binding protein [Desulfobulbaceae bacterium]
MPPRKTASKKAPKRPVRKRPMDHNHIIRFLLIIGGIITLGIGSGLGWFFSLDIPDIRSFDDYRPLVTTTVLDRDGRMIDAIYAENRIVLRFDEINPLIPMAFVAAEDGRYWDHAGLDVWSVFRAFINNLRSGHRSQGGSTITQQVTRGLMLSREKTYFRKVKEAILAYRLDKMLSKEDILAIYLNEIYLGEGAYGVEAAARTYFGKQSSRLNLAETALLAGLPQSPSRYSPIAHFDKAQARQRYVLNRMADEDYITPKQARDAYNLGLHFNQPREMKNLYGYFTDHIRQELEKQFGRKKLLREGLVVTTTLDSRLQAKAVEAVRQGIRNLEKNSGTPPPQAALVTLDAATGQILAMVGGADYTSSPFNRASSAKRQPGSVFKPLIYAAAFEQGISAGLTIDDAPLTIRNPDGSSWSPRNWSNKHYGPTTLEDGLVHSRNIVAIKLLQKTGTKPVLKLAREAGIRSPLQPELTLALGASPVSLLEMTGAYTIFTNQGKFARPSAITGVRDRRGKTLSWSGSAMKRVISPDAAHRVSSLLGQVISRGTGQQARGIPGSAGKTGTTDNNRDGWFIGYNHRLLTGVWVGHDQNNTLGQGATGGRIAAPIWLDFMQSTSRQ